MFCCFFGNVDLVKLLLENVANPNVRDKYGEFHYMRRVQEGMVIL
ncbi:ankyrin repeat domain-containing protein [Wolbachia pipientis]